MSSNTPPHITPITNTNTNTSPNDANTPQVNVVTQPTQLSQEFDLISTPSHHRNQSTNFEDEHDDFQIEHLLEHCNSTHTPIMAESTIPHFPTPTNQSPDTSKKRLHSVMESTTMDNADRADAARVMVAMASSSGKKRYNPNSTMLMFLRNAEIDNEKSKMKLTGKPIINTTPTLQLAKRKFKRVERDVQTLDVKFQQHRLKMDSLSAKGMLPPPLTVFHNRLLLEDIMMTEHDDELVFLIHQKHKFVKGTKETWWSRRIKSIGGNGHASHRLNYIIFQSNLYWALRVTVVSNPQRESLLNKEFTEDDIVRGCTQQGGWGIRIRLATNEQQNLLFEDLLMAPVHLQLWADDQHTNYKTMRNKLRKLSGINLGGTTKRLIQEAYGDSLLCEEICHRYTTTISAATDKVKSNVVKESTISSEKIKAHYKLEANYQPFINFRNTVDDACKEAILRTYGKFNAITDPILTYTQVRIYRFRKHLLS
jgi:hypothetical protein